MKNILFIVVAFTTFTACSNKKDSSDKNIVIMSDTANANNSYLSDTGVAKAPVAVAPVVVAAVPKTNTTSRTNRSTSSSTGNSNNNSTASNSGSSSSGSSNSTTTTKKTGWSKAAKGSVIGGVGGAVIGAAVSKKKGKGAIIGGVAGAAGGYIIGRGQDRKDGRVGN